MPAQPSPGFCSFLGAEDILSRSVPGFFGRDAAYRVFDMPLHEPPALRSSRDDIRAAARRGEQLIWFPKRDYDHSPMTMAHMVSLRHNQSPSGGAIISRGPADDWLCREGFFMQETPRGNGYGSWRFVSADPVPGTLGEDYLEQTRIAAAYVRDIVYAGEPPACVAHAFDELAASIDDLRSLMKRDRFAACIRIAGLRFTKLFRETAVEAMMRWLIVTGEDGANSFEDRSSLTASFTASGMPVAFGFTKPHGTVIDGFVAFSTERHGFYLSRPDRLEEEAGMLTAA